LVLGDFYDISQKIPDKCFDLLVLDWPYDIGKAEWDNILNYTEWCGKVLKEHERMLKDNGSLYVFHNDFRKIRDIDSWIEKNTKFDFKQFIIWNKRFKESQKYGYLNGFIETENLHNYQKMCEYILYYTFNNFYKIKEKREELNLTQKIISKEVKSKTDGLTGWLSNIEKGRNYPNEKHIKAIKKHLDINLTELIPTFNNLKSHHSVWTVDVWDYDIAEDLGHPTQKPLSLIENIILHSSNEGDLIGDFFCGSGTTLVACKKLKRKWFGCDNNKEYYDLSKNRLNSTSIFRDLASYKKQEPKSLQPFLEGI
jgi:site-specific DNA-methyltransferase (adenine-specific)